MTTTPCTLHEHLQLVKQRVPNENHTAYGYGYILECAACEMQWPLEQNGHDMHVAVTKRCPKCWRVGQCDPVCVDDVRS